MKQVKILILPGWQDSKQQHWQSIWLKKYPNAIKVFQDNWMYPRKHEWVKTLDEYIKNESNNSIILVGHSLACATIAHWSKEYFSKNSTKIIGALLVSPADVDRPDFPKEIKGFSPMPLEPLNFNTIVVGSEDDPYVNIDRSKYFAQCWKAKLVNIGPRGHINVDAGLGDWPDGEKLLQQLMK